MAIYSGFSTKAFIIIFCAGCSLQSADIPVATPISNKAVVFDIDGTLTPSVLAFTQVRDDSAKTVQLFADSGYKIIYLSARVKMLQAPIPDWLKENGFPEGYIQVPQTSTDSKDHAGFKERIITQFKNNGWDLVAAYGDSSTDFQAYNKVGIEKDHIFALKRKNKEECEVGSWAKCLDSWQPHWSDIDNIIQHSDR